MCGKNCRRRIVDQSRFTLNYEKLQVRRHADRSMPGGGAELTNIDCISVWPISRLLIDSPIEIILGESTANDVLTVHNADMHARLFLAVPTITAGELCRKKLRLPKLSSPLIEIQVLEHARADFYCNFMDGYESRELGLMC